MVILYKLKITYLHNLASTYKVGNNISMPPLYKLENNMHAFTMWCMREEEHESTIMPHEQTPICTKIKSKFNLLSAWDM